MESEPGKNQPPRVRKYVGIFVRGDGETRDGESIKGVNILESRLVVALHGYESLEREAAKRRLQSIPAEVLPVKSGDIIFAREIPERSIIRMIVNGD